MNKHVEDLNYNYVYFNSTYSGGGIIDPNEYNSICLRDLEEVEGTQVVPCFFDYAPRIVRRAYNFISSKQHNKLQTTLYPFVFKNKLPQNNKKICFVIAKNVPLSYLTYLRRKYTGCKIVKVYRDLIKVGQGMNSEYTLDNTRKYFDLQFSFDKDEAMKYGFIYFDEIESKINIPIDPNYPISDVFFAGKAKDRLPKILEAYHIFNSIGLKCDFYITHVPKEDRVDLPGITYSDSFMPYNQMLFRTINSRCMLDINQSGAVGYTSRFLEAVIYNKKIILDNPAVKNSRYYDPKYIQLVDSIGDIDPNFVISGDVVDYGYQGDFSPVRLISLIDKELSKQ